MDLRIDSPGKTSAFVDSLPQFTCLGGEGGEGGVRVLGVNIVKCRNATI